jgi:acetolactate synthase small subunit
MTSTTGTSIENYLSWVKNELEKKDYGEVSITFTITRGQITDVKKGSIDTEHHPLQKENVSTNTINTNIDNYPLRLRTHV